MSKALSASMKRHPLLAFYVLAFAVTWIAWAPQVAYSRGLIGFNIPALYVTGGAGPLIAAYLVLLALDSRSVNSELFGSLLQWRIRPQWYVVGVLGYFVVWLAALAWDSGSGAIREAVALSPGLLTGFAVSAVAAVPEEVGWRGFALSRLQARHSALVSSLIMGVLWGLWHLPLLLDKTNVMSRYPFVPYMLCVIAVSVVYTWIFNSTGGSVFAVTLFHAASNALAGPFVGAEQTVLFAAVALALVIAFGADCLSTSRARVVKAVALDSALARGVE